MSHELVSRLERGQLRGVTIESLDRIATALDATLVIQLRWQGEQLDRMLDAAHASLQESVTQMLAGAGYLVRTEVSFNHFGDRGRVDVVAFHAPTQILLVVEIKSVLGDLQETLGRLDIKTRVGAVLCRELGWPSPSAAVPVLVMGERRTARRIVERHAALFLRFSLRGLAARRWVSRPELPAPAGLLWFHRLSDSRQSTHRSAAQ